MKRDERDEMEELGWHCDYITYDVNWHWSSYSYKKEQSRLISHMAYPSFIQTSLQRTYGPTIQISAQSLFLFNNSLHDCALELSNQ